jgi:hypothetical protein
MKNEANNNEAKQNEANYEELIDAYLDGELTESQCHDLQLWLASDHANMRQLLLAAHLHTELDAWASGEQLSTQPITQPKSNSIAAVLAVLSSSRAVLFGNRIAQGLVATVVCLFIFFMTVSGRSTTEPFLLVAEGNVVLVRDGQESPAAKNMFVQVGDTVHVGAESIATLAYRGEETEVTLDAGTKLRIGRHESGSKLLELASGGIRASVAKQPANKPMLVRTGTAQATVLGTRFELQSHSDLTHLQVEHGQVQISQPNALEDAKLVSQYYSAEVRNGTIVVQPSPVYMNSLLEEGLIAHWPMDEGRGTTLKDSSGNGRDGIIAGANWRAGYKNSGLAFRTAHSHVKIENISLPQQFSISVWGRVDEKAERGQPVLSNTDVEGMTDGFRLMINVTKEGEPRAVFYASDGKVANKATSAQGLLSISQWHHVVATVDRELGLATVYVDGVKASESTPVVQNFKSQGPLRIGQFGLGVTGPPDRVLDDLRIYSRILSIDEIRLLADKKP